ncbi:glycosyltransferase [Nesterenkonia sp. MY13]|uniref:Glycosyltransferase n=1 Tax=Nesterenkonia sedimenti TaxID=1463632 RepID=A0A7X8TJP2_9MICC|nr:glycosyltransferase [Nesterenkonia sedimenti]NLS10055.1 glycosyltransferase [Nesterenkonia sedimenti]
MSRFTDLRRRLGRISRSATEEELAAVQKTVAELAGEVSILSAKLDVLGSDQPREVDIALVSDFRLPGGTTASIAEEVRAQSAAGLTTALIHAQSEATKTSTGFSKHIQAVMDLPGVHVVSPRAALHAELLVVRHPLVAQTAAAGFKHISAESVLLVANHPAVDAAGTWHYDVAATTARLTELFGTDPLWAPISPVVRDSIAAQEVSRIQLREQDWVNIFGTETTATPRTGFTAHPPIIGRHSRPQKEKWPATAEEMLAAYPENGQHPVRILGGGEIPEKVLGRVPHSWEVLPFGAAKPADFLQGVDFWVYMHHPEWKEAFGRAIIEALAAGCVVILPTYLKAVFGEAALYSDPAGVSKLIDRISNDEEAYLAQSRLGQEFALNYGPARHLARLADHGVMAE